MYLGELIEKLEAEDPRRVLPFGFHRPHSYRGYYERLAFEPAQNITIGEILDAAKSADGATYCGWKGGEFKMGRYTEVYLAEEGNTGDEIGPCLLSYILHGRPNVDLKADLGG